MIYNMMLSRVSAIDSFMGNAGLTLETDPLMTMENLSLAVLLVAWVASRLVNLCNTGLDVNERQEAVRSMFITALIRHQLEEPESTKAVSSFTDLLAVRGATRAKHSNYNFDSAGASPRLAKLARLCCA